MRCGLCAVSIVLWAGVVGAWATDDDVCYVLQHDSVTAADLTNAGFHWMILEPSRDGGASGDLTAAEIAQIRNDGPCRKTLLAYLSIGEAEDYRDYWDPAWVDSNGDPIPGAAPAWLGPVNPDFPGNYKVRYWDPAWQALMFGTPTGPNKTPLDRIIDQGFDGVYLDIIDAYEFWSDPNFGVAELTRMEARTKMIDLVEAIADYAHVTRGRPSFLVFPQNAADIIRDDNDQLDAESNRYFAAVSGIGQEDLYYNELTPQPPNEVSYTLDQLREFYMRGKTVIVTDYVIRQNNPTPAANDARVADFYTRCRNDGFVPYAAHRNRDLNEVVTFTVAGGWSYDQPAPGCLSQPGDVNGDGHVDIGDLGALLAAFGTCSGQPTFNVAADFDGSGCIDISDLGQVLANFGN